MGEWCAGRENNGTLAKEAGGGIGVVPGIEVPGEVAGLKEAGGCGWGVSGSQSGLWHLRSRWVTAWTRPSLSALFGRSVSLMLLYLTVWFTHEHCYCCTHARGGEEVVLMVIVPGNGLIAISVVFLTIMVLPSFTSNLHSTICSDGIVPPWMTRQLWLLAMWQENAHARPCPALQCSLVNHI